MLYAAKHYDMAKAASEEEFLDDVKRFQYLKKLFKRYDEDNELRVRLILNHMIILYNCFGPGATQMLFMRLEEYHSYLAPFVIFLSYMPDIISYDEKTIRSSEISLDTKIVQELRAQL